MAARLNASIHTRGIATLSSHGMQCIGRKGVQWLSGRVFDSRPRGRGFKPLCVLEQDTFILA